MQCPARRFRLCRALQTERTRPAWFRAACALHPQSCHHIAAHIVPRRSEACGPQFPSHFEERFEIIFRVIRRVKPVRPHVVEQVCLPLLQQCWLKAPGKHRRMSLPLQHRADIPEVLLAGAQYVVVEDVPAVRDRQFANCSSCAARHGAEPAVLRAAARGEDQAVAQIQSRNKVAHAVIERRASNLDRHAENLPGIIKVFRTRDVPGERHGNMYLGHACLYAVRDILDRRLFEERQTISR